MADRHGTPIWYELASNDPDGAGRFYGAVLGWRFGHPPGSPERDDRIAQAGDAAVAGLVRRPDGTAMPVRWLVHFGVEDVDRGAERAREAGAAISIPPTDIPDVGRFALLLDPQGQAFSLMRGASREPSRAFASGADAAQGHAVWNELSTADPDAALEFYGRVLGLRAEGGMPMGDLGEYRFLHAGAVAVGAVMGEVPNAKPGWLVYFSADDIDGAKHRLEQAGGRSLEGPHEIPGGRFSLLAEDDRGVRFGLVGPRTTATDASAA